MKNMRYIIRALLVMILYTMPAIDSLGLPIRTISNVGVLYSQSSLTVTEIVIANEATHLSFATSCNSVTSFSIGHDISIVDDDGTRHPVTCAIDIDFDSVYTITPGAQIYFTLIFGPVSSTNKALDVEEGGRLTILGLHDANHSLNIPQYNKQGHYQTSLPIGARSVIIDGIVHKSDSSFSPKKVAVQYVPPTGFGLPSQNYMDFDASGRFHTEFTMYSPQIVFIYTTGSNGVDGNALIFPGDSVFIDIYNNRVEYISSSEAPNLNKVYSLPILRYARKYRENLFNGRITNSGTGISTDYVPFSMISYKEQRQQLLDEYARVMTMVDYVCWHCRLSAHEKDIYSCRCYNAYIDILLSTDNLAARLYNESPTEENKAMYDIAMEMETYEYLRHIPQDTPAFLYYDDNSSIPSLLLSTPPMRECESLVSKDNIHWCMKTIKQQQKTLAKMTGWKSNSFMSQAVLVESYLRMKRVYPEQFDTSGQELYDWMCNHITDAYYLSLIKELGINS